MIRADIAILVELGLLELTATTTDGNWQEFKLTGNGRIMAEPRVLPRVQSLRALNNSVRTRNGRITPANSKK